MRNAKKHTPLILLGIIGLGIATYLALPLFIEKTVNEPLPMTMNQIDERQVLVEGVFRDADDFHQSSGQAQIITDLDGMSILRLSDFFVTNGPDLRVYLTKHPDPQFRSDFDNDYIELGKLKGNQGNQNYQIPEGIDPSEYQSVVIYCKPFRVIFGVAPMELTQ